MFGEGTDMNALLQQAQAMQEQLMSAQQELAETEVTGTSGGGLIVATVSGAGELLGLEIKPEACDPEDTESLADLIVAAVRDANNQASALAQSKMGPLTGGLEGMGGMPGVPGL